jgi:hypothetical protein
VIPHISGKNTAKDMWKALRNLYKPKNENRVMVLCERLSGTKMAKGEGVVPYLTGITQIRDELAAVGKKIEESELVHVALNDFSKSWDVFVRGFMAREKLLDWQRLWDDFVQEEIWLGQLGGSSSSPQIVDEEGLALASKGKGKAKKKGGKKKGIDFSKVKCSCVTRHHSVWRRRRKTNHPQMATSAAVDEFAKSFEEDFCFVACMSSVAVSDIWFVDSGASCHMTGHKEFFTRLQEGGVNLVIELEMKGTTRCKGLAQFRFRGSWVNHSDLLTYFVLGLTKYLILVSTLEDKGYEITFCNVKVFVRPVGCRTKMDRIIRVRQERVYILEVEPARALVNTTTDMGELWHRRMAHIHFGALGHLRQEVIGLPKFTAERHDPCKSCAMGKYARRPFPPSKHRSKWVLDLMHSDVCGPMSVESVSGFEYFVLFIDDYFRKTWIYFLKAKDEVFDKFQEFRALVENQTSRKIWVLRSDNRGEYTFKEFVDYCVAAWIKKELTVPYNPQ